MSLTNKYLNFSYILIMFSIISCNKNRVFHEVKKFEDFKWGKSEKVHFEIPISQIDTEYKLLLNLRYIEGFPYKYLHLNIEITPPDGKIETNELTIEIISDSKQYIGDGAGSYWDLDFEIQGYNIDQIGKYKISFEHAMEEEILNWTNEVGLSVLQSASDDKP